MQALYVDVSQTCGKDYMRVCVDGRTDMYAGEPKDTRVDMRRACACESIRQRLDSPASMPFVLVMAYVVMAYIIMAYRVMALAPASTPFECSIVRSIERSISVECSVQTDWQFLCASHLMLDAMAERSSFFIYTHTHISRVHNYITREAITPQIMTIRAITTRAITSFFPSGPITKGPQPNRP